MLTLQLNQLEFPLLFFATPRPNAKPLVAAPIAMASWPSISPVNMAIIATMAMKNSLLSILRKKRLAVAENAESRLPHLYTPIGL